MLCVAILLCKFSSQSFLCMSNPFVKHVRGTMFDSIRREICMILCGNLPLLLPTIPGTQPTVSGTRLNVACTRLVVACTRPMVAGTDPDRALNNFTSYSCQMFDPSVKHVQGTRLGSIRCETCMILRGNLSLLLPNVTSKRQIV
jgi:hypothetical protein